MERNSRMSKHGGAEGSGISKEEWAGRLERLHVSRTDMNRLIMNYLVTEGFKDAAEKFSQESGVSAGVNLSSLDDRIKIRDAIREGRISDATDVVNKLHPELLDSDRYLYFHLQQQHLIELIRAGRIEEALAFAQQSLAERGEENTEVLAELERTLALLAFEDPANSPFGDLLNSSHRQKVASELNAAILRLESSADPTTRLETLLKLVLWAQGQLDQKKVSYPRMTDLASGALDD
ncbi:glucose-induced degradation protein 8-A homolog isoform X1 [Amphibalanus amphitrite]|uniref:glucose-induced degradation protein 8-A homolog isoform X1 n=2 Tax=Amphibalanus amphitrite TaxID=1232801 RepID=UPI001C913E29|nr:glucose-induced degradation protein 8-A homolog isoform X1 [Amphibalanus amphitrite]XP_043189989.1 glucose-induced degradation protein 8-A homolog isoform X1 [Amphibalanus amphitrite]XP_043189990.1 glucose-induced degradation protein 8-A homolog isoform X1 [Amphibalanus amphitrite]XP_043189991.1 glucose-induced degradation protein 8-A homolog isoform X1 [Amphibalanus amphitrite]XP_043189992.1 glucose-induced degradation protein 8-A homolog isoform X1 [Amphibalanus amphitrite]XP_043189993.1 